MAKSKLTGSPLGPMLPIPGFPAIPISPGGPLESRS